MKRGRLKIFFGIAPGVGKTYAMVKAALEQRSIAVDVVVGLIEIHGSEEIKNLLNAMEILPTRIVSDRVSVSQAFDIDAVLTRHPALVLIDDLAATNPAGSRHHKRWQDIYELLEAGIDVYTTLNVQHLESLNDDLSQILGRRISDTLPDTVFERADEVQLVDLAPDDLLFRLKQGQIHIPYSDSSVSSQIFRKGNLIALRELALKQMALRVDAQMLGYRAAHAIGEVWPVGERILVCIGPNDLAERLVRAGKRLANSLRAEWVVAYVETPVLMRLPAETRDAVLRILRLAEQLGAETVTLSAPEMSEAILRFASERNINKVLVGKPSRRGWKRWLLGSVVDALIDQANNVSVYMLGSSQLNRPEGSGDAEYLFKQSSPPGLRQRFSSNAGRRYTGFGWAVIVTLCSTLLGHWMMPYLELSNLVMLFLLGVVFIATHFGRGPSIFASILAVGVFDLFFVAPYLSFSPANSQYLITLVAMLVVAIVISNLMVNVRSQARVAAHRERRAAALYAMSKELAGSQSEDDIISIAVRHLYTEFRGCNVLLFPDRSGRLIYPSSPSGVESLLGADLGVAQWVFEHNEMAGQGTHTLPEAAAIYFPVHDENKVLGVLAMQPSNLRRLFLPEQRKFLETFLRQIAQALTRVRLAEQANLSQIEIEAERLRNSLLSAISHDLRTPLATIVGSASALAEDDGHLQAQHKLDLSRAIVDEAERMANLVNNILDMARLDSGTAKLNKQWYPVEEIIGSVLTRLHKHLDGRLVNVQMPPGLPMLYADTVMVEQVLINLLENSIRYTPVGSVLEIIVEANEQEVKISVADHGAGIPAGVEEKLFEKFYQAQQEGAQSGVGLGLAICRAIVEVHGGHIHGRNRPEGGAIFTLSLPIEQAPPVLVPEDAFP